MEYLRCLVVLVLAASGCAESEFAADEQNKGKQTTHSKCAFLLLWKIVTAKKKDKTTDVITEGHFTEQKTT